MSCGLNYYFNNLARPELRPLLGNKAIIGEVSIKKNYWPERKLGDK
jgi:hypothetical protein